MKNSTFLVIATVCMVVFLLMVKRGLNLVEYAINQSIDRTEDQPSSEKPMLSIEQSKPIGFVLSNAERQ